RLEACLATHAYRPHRHDTYAIGITLAGVQRYNYRRSRRESLPGEVVVLYPDELHDGEAGTEIALLYRMLYIRPEAVRDALGGRARSLPFVRDGHSKDRRLAKLCLAPSRISAARSRHWRRRRLYLTWQKPCFRLTARSLRSAGRQAACRPSCGAHANSSTKLALYRRLHITSKSQRVSAALNLRVIFGAHSARALIVIYSCVAWSRRAK